MSKLANRYDKTQSGQYFERQTFWLGNVFQWTLASRSLWIYYTCYAKHFEISLTLQRGSSIIIVHIDRAWSNSENIYRNYKYTFYQSWFTDRSTKTNVLYILGLVSKTSSNSQTTPCLAIVSMKREHLFRNRRTTHVRTKARGYFRELHSTTSRKK